MADEELARRTEGSLDVQGEGAQAPSTGVFKHRELQDVLVEVHGDVSSQLVWEVVQELNENSGQIDFFRVKFTNSLEDC